MTEDEIILTHILKCTRADLILKKQKLDPSQERQYKEYRSRRAKGEPLQYILGSWDFYGLEFNVSPGVLIPRPETEGLVDAALKNFKGVDILDLGTGSGNIAITMAKLLPYVQVTTVDTSLDAIEVAINNAQIHGVESRVEFVHADMRDFLVSHEKRYDMVISNPPYIPSPQMSHLPLDVQQEPSIALDGGEDGLDFYRLIIKTSPYLITRGGYLIMEFGDGQAEAIKDLARAQPLFSHREIFKDLAGKDRIILLSTRSV